MEKSILHRQKADNTQSIIFIIGLTALCCFNLIYFLSVAANPLIQSDAWYFLDVNIGKWITQGFNWSDLFVKRGIVDHAQPLNKFFLYLNYRFFNLDFTIESIIGLMGLLLIISFFLFRFLTILNSRKLSLDKIAAFTMAILVATSLNSTNLFSWSLVTFSFLPLSIAFACSWLSWHYLHNHNKFLCALLLSISVLAIGDTASIILWAALAGTIFLVGLSLELKFKKSGAIMLLLLGVFIATIFLIINWKFLFIKPNPASVKQSKLLLSDLNFYLETLRIVFSSSIIHGTHLTAFGDASKIVSWIIAMPIFYFYLDHFFSLIFKRKPASEIDFIVTFILVYASISIVAIILGRVPEFGVSYLNQPRYLVVYQLLPFSLLIKWAFSEDAPYRKNYFSLSVISIVTCIFIFMIQFLVSVSAYRSVPWMWKWYVQQKVAINNYVMDPDVSPGNCTPHSVPICSMSTEKRNNLLKLLQVNRLNLFNPNFQNRYRLFIDQKSCKIISGKAEE